MALPEAISPGGTAMINYVANNGETPFVDVFNHSNNRFTLDPREMEVRDARSLVDTLSLENEGFQLVQHATRMRREDFRVRHYIDAIHLREMEGIIKDVTGAELVICSASPLVRLNTPEAEKLRLARPAPLAHSDYTDFTFDVQLEHEVPTDAPALAEFKRIISDLQIDDMILFKGFEGEDADHLQLLHSGATIPNLPADAAPRESIETRALAFFRD